MSKIILLLVACTALFSSIVAQRHDVLYYGNDYIEGYRFDVYKTDSSYMEAELSKVFGGFELDIIHASLYYQSKLWGASMGYVQSGQEDLEMYGETPTTEAIGYFGVYSKLFTISANYTVFDIVTLYGEAKVRRYSVIDDVESTFFGSFYLGNKGSVLGGNYKVFAGIWNSTPGEKSVGHVFANYSKEISSFTLIPALSVKYYDKDQSAHANIKCEAIYNKLVGLYVRSLVTGNNIFGAGVSVSYQGFGLSYEFDLYQDNVDAVHEVIVKIPIL